MVVDFMHPRLLQVVHRRGNLHPKVYVYIPDYKNKANSLTPVTIRQVLDATPSPSGDEAIKIDDVVIGQVPQTSLISS